MFTAGQIYQLETGFDYGAVMLAGGGFTGGAPLYRGGPGWFEAGAAWQFLRPQIMRSWLAREPDSCGHGGPGTRPCAWWLFDAKQLRRRLDGVHPFDDEHRDAIIAEYAKQYPAWRSIGRRTFFGVPSCLCTPEDHTATYETEAEYLERLSLWLPGEREQWESLQ